MAFGTAAAYQPVGRLWYIVRMLPPDLAELAQSARNPQAGFFGPGSYAWRILRENTLQLAGPSAALMQIAHPQVGQGVGEHSNFKDDPVGRLKRTFIAVHKIVFGSVDNAMEAAMHSRQMHAKVKGTVPQAHGTFEAGARYHANRVDLLLWVHATLVDGAIDAHTRFIGPLEDEAKEGYYQEMKIFGRIFGIPQDKFPKRYPDFAEYYQDMIKNVLVVSPKAREISESILKGAGIYRPAEPLLRLLAAGMMPANIREGFGLPWNFPMELALDAFTAQIRRARPYTPDLVLYRHAYLRSMKRARAPLPPREGRRPPKFLKFAAT